MVRLCLKSRFQTLLIVMTTISVSSSAPISSSASGEISRVIVPPKIAQLIEFSFPSSVDQSRQEGNGATAEVFGYRLDDDGPRQFHQESRNSGVWRGSYGFGSPSGVFGAVEYVADDSGYRALVKSRQPNLVLWNDIRGARIATGLKVPETEPS